VNIDDGFTIADNTNAMQRTPEGELILNEKFPDMVELGRQIHALGLKFGVYSSPGPSTCGGYAATWEHEQQDVDSFVKWGVDYLKYDWCSYNDIAPDRSLDELKKPYLKMRDILLAADRDIVFSMCQYGMGEVWKWGEEVGGNLWRTTGDITDTWESMRDIGFSQAKAAPYGGPGHWNDPDMLVVGWVGWGPSLHPSKLTPDEQYTHISLWCLQSAPLLIGCDLERLDEFTLNLLTNDEVLAVDQDPLGKPAVPVIEEEDFQVWVKEMADGSQVAGIFNLGEKSAGYSLDLKTLGYKGRVKIRDLWRQRDLDLFEGKFSCKVPAHGVVLVSLVEE
jgi:hypothetical protein